jgi:NitT/TauT family transport system permease protein
MKSLKNIIPLIFFVFIIALWEFIPLMFSVPDYVFPRLSDIIPAIIKAKPAFVANSMTTLGEAFIGFLIGSLTGFFTGVLMAQSRIIAKSILPYVVASNAIPIVAIAPIVVIWFGHGITSKIILAAFLCFFPLAINTFRGLIEYPAIYRELFNTYGATNYEFLAKFKIRNAVPYIFAGLKLSASYSVIGAIVAEFIGSTSGLGFGMLQASYNLNTPRLFGYLFIACIMGLFMYYTIVLIEYLLFNHKNKKS